MTSRPIIFSGPMVKAILDGRKTQTRRVVKPPNGMSMGSFDRFQPPITADDVPCCWFGGRHIGMHSRWVDCPYGRPGDRLWVRETWAAGDAKNPPELIWYRADNTLRAMDGTALDTFGMPEPAWKPSIHMPRWASRLTLELCEVRVERVQDISEEDALAEGIIEIQGASSWRGKPMQPWTHYAAYHSSLHGRPCAQADTERGTPRVAFAALWDSINGTRGFWDGQKYAYSWDANPFVWVLSFRRVTP